MLYNRSMTVFTALCALGAEKILSNELEHTGFSPLRKYQGRVSFTAAPGEKDSAAGRPATEKTQSFSPFPSGPDLEALIRANLWLRTADRVYIETASFPALDFDDLYDGIRRIRWFDFFKKDVRPVIDKVRVNRSKLNSEHSVQSVAHKAVFDCLGNAWHMKTLPETGEQRDIRIYIEDNRAFVLLDTSGEPLYRRGYRRDGGTAPLRETLAASILHFMTWRRKIPLHDAFCGSGTIPIEASLFACNIAPGLARRFSFETLTPFIDGEGSFLLSKARAEAADAVRTDCLVRVSGSDVDSAVISAAEANAERAFSAAGAAMQKIGRAEKIPRPRFFVSGFSSLVPPHETGMLVSNPPYGIRLGTQEEAGELYKEMALLRKNFRNWSFGFICAEENFENDFGMKADSKRKFKSGRLESFFYAYINKQLEK